MSAAVFLAWYVKTTMSAAVFLACSMQIRRPCRRTSAVLLDCIAPLTACRSLPSYRPDVIHGIDPITLQISACTSHRRFISKAELLFRKHLPKESYEGSGEPNISWKTAKENGNTTPCSLLVLLTTTSSSNTVTQFIIIRPCSGGSGDRGT